MPHSDYFKTGYLDGSNPEGITMFNRSQFEAIQNRDVNLAMALGVPLDRYLQFLNVIY